MEKVKKVLDRIFIEGLSAMAHGLFATLIIGTIIQQIGTFMGGNIGEMIFLQANLRLPYRSRYRCGSSL